MAPRLTLRCAGSEQPLAAVSEDDARQSPLGAKSEAQQGYGRQAAAYRSAGWEGVLPLPHGQKFPPPSGYTGQAGVVPSADQVRKWADELPDGNLALRLPEWLMGIDVDDYGEKRGAAALGQLEARLGRLPETVVSTSRTGPSGIRLFRVPSGLRFRDPGGGIEVVSFGHRYVVAWPSTHPDTGAGYRWVDQRSGEVLASPPDPRGLPELPGGWVDHLGTRPGNRRPLAMAADVADIEECEVDDWLASCPDADGEPCQVTRGFLSGFLDGLADGAHSAAQMVTARLLRAAEQGHRGVQTALTEARERFLEVVVDPTRPGHRSGSEARGEWGRLLEGAYTKFVQGDPTTRAEQRCRCSPRAGNSRSHPTKDEEEVFWEARERLRNCL
jgi:hypothetical protein